MEKCVAEDAGMEEAGEEGTGNFSNIFACCCKKFNLIYL